MEELIKNSFGISYIKSYHGPNVITDIKANKRSKTPNTFLYIYSNQFDAGDGTGYDVGTIRCGYSGDNVTITSISKRGPFGSPTAGVSAEGLVTLTISKTSNIFIIA